MFFVSKLVESALLPSNDIALLALLGLLALILRRKKLGLTLLILSAILLFLAGWSPLGPALVMALEDRFPPPASRQTVAGIVMLGGAVNIIYRKIARLLPSMTMPNAWTPSLRRRGDILAPAFYCLVELPTPKANTPSVNPKVPAGCWLILAFLKSVLNSMSSRGRRLRTRRKA